MRPAEWARLAGLGLITTGGLFGTIENGILEDLVPAAAGTLLFLLSFVGEKRVVVPIGFWWLLLLIGLSARTSADLRETVSLTGATIAFLAGANLRTDDAGRRVILGAALVLGALALYQRFVIFPVIAPLLEHGGRGRLDSGRIFSAFVLPAQFGAYLAMILPLAITETWVGRFRRFSLIAVFLVSGCLLLNGSFSAVLAVGAGLFYLFGMNQRSLIALLALAIMTAGIISYRYPADPLAISVPVTWRIETWRGSIEGMMKAPILGHGPGSFPVTYNSRFRSVNVHATRHPHSWPVKIGFESGTVGLAAFLLLWSALLTPPRDRSWRAAAIAFGIASLLDVADHSVTLRAFGLFALGASLKATGCNVATFVTHGKSKVSQSCKVAA